MAECLLKISHPWNQVGEEEEDGRERERLNGKRVNGFCVPMRSDCSTKTEENQTKPNQTEKNYEINN